ncbi:hypothetical protein TOPH_00108 [Tolypocladium ophioglossoides CBS 100239]|uniref:Dihydroneopterin aldolase/epimerase domain-containing protein n=1 Tax=Tolypocladium ophioglossoides (strain CBS 100239) TaxID=1163406 RepID=A0A0L0NL08_TOLOC|nr:hypothetical protein TOPH_00108 [Tolypocladium ophioglossoides CBS 100239]
MSVARRSLWNIHVAVGEAPAVVRVNNLHATVKGPNDAWGRRNRPQPMQISVKVELRKPFSATSRADALASDTVHYGQLSKAILASLESLATAAEQAPWPFSLSEVLAYVWLDLTGFYPTGKRAESQEPFLDTSVVRCLEMTVHLPKASLVGDGVSFAFTGVFGNDLNGTSMRLHGRTLRLHNLRVPTLIGINDNEREAKQAAVVNVEIDNFGATSDIFNSLEAKIVDNGELVLWHPRGAGRGSFGNDNAVPEDGARGASGRDRLAAQDYGGKAAGGALCGRAVRGAEDEHEGCAVASHV